MTQRPVHHHPRTSALASLLVSATLLSACGGGGSEAPETHPMAGVQPGGMAASAAITGDHATAAAIATTQPGTADGATGVTANAGSSSTTATSPGTSDTPATATTAPDVYIHVDAAGSDANTGASQTSTGSDGPVKSIARAQQLARAKIAAMVAGATPRAPLHVVIGPGEYVFNSTMTFTPADSGTAAAPVSYEARQAGTVLISGGIALGTQTGPAALSAINFAVPAGAASSTGAGQFFINGRRAVLARQPNVGEAWFVQRAVPVSGEAAGSEGAEAFAPNAAGLAWINGLSTTDKQRVILDVLQAWTDGRHRLSTQVAPEGSVRISPRALWPFLSQGGISQRFFVENAVAALDAAGEWIYDNGVIRYIRQSDEVGVALKATLPTVDRLVLIQGESSKPLQNLRFVGLSFAYTRYSTPDAGFTDHQAAYEVSAAIEVNKSRGVVFDSCNVYGTGGWGIWFRDGVRDSRVISSRFNDLGAGAIKMGLNSQSPSDVNASGANQFISNFVGNTGKLFPGAVAVWVGQTWDNVVRANAIYNTTYTAISVGWSWGYATPTSGRNLIKGNLIYNVGQRQTSDIAGIYTLGQSPGTVINNNVVRSVRGYNGYGAGAWGIYSDEGSSDILIENNVILGTDNGAYHINYGKNNIVRSNVMAGGDAAEVRVSTLESNAGASLEGNLIAPKVLQPFEKYAQAPSMSFYGNEVTSTLSGAGLVLTKCGAGCTLGSSSILSTTNPVDIRSASESWNTLISNAIATWSGVPAGTQLNSKVASSNLPPVADAPTALLAPAVDFVADIGGTAINSRPSNVVYTPKENTAAIRVEAQADAPNGRCLAFNDGATFANRWEPYAYVQLNYTKGVTAVEFELKIDSNSVLVSEWRDGTSNYLVGPTLQVTAAGVTVNGTIVAPITVGAWTKFRITSPTGTAGAKWTLEVTRTSDGQRNTISNLVAKDAGWKDLKWLGFVSDTAATSRPCIATMKASNVD